MKMTSQDQQRNKPQPSSPFAQQQLPQGLIKQKSKILGGLNHSSSFGNLGAMVGGGSRLKNSSVRA
jgi:hypothetical protein